jgi:hypothetical protein
MGGPPLFKPWKKGSSLVWWMNWGVEGKWYVAITVGDGRKYQSCYMAISFTIGPCFWEWQLIQTYSMFLQLSKPSRIFISILRYIHPHLWYICSGFTICHLMFYNMSIHTLQYICSCFRIWCQFTLYNISVHILCAMIKTVAVCSWGAGPCVLGMVNYPALLSYGST